MAGKHCDGKASACFVPRGWAAYIIFLTPAYMSSTFLRNFDFLLANAANLW